VDKNGRERWTFRTGGWVDASPAIGSDGSIYCGSWDKNFYAVTPEGRKKWEFATGGPIVGSAAIGAEGFIYFGSHDRKFYALNPDGSKRWEFTTGGGVISSPAIGTEGTVYFTSLDGDLRALNPDGAMRWKFHTGGTTAAGPVLGPTGEIFITGNNQCFALGPDGTLRWQWPISQSDSEPLTQASCTALANGNTIVVPGGGLMVELSAGTNWVWDYWLGGRSYSSPLVGPDGTVYALGFHSELQAVQHQVPLAKSSWPMFRANPQRTGRVPNGN
jgi:outer membrane protein assembly factor BamB